MGATPFNPLTGVWPPVVVALTDMSGGSRGRVPFNEVVALRLAAMESMDGRGFGTMGDIGLLLPSMSMDHALSELCAVCTVVADKSEPKSMKQ